MSKKLILACMAVAAFAAFVLPATASASPRLCETSGEVCNNVAVGTKIKATSVGTNLILWNTGHTEPLVTCNKATMTGTLNKNSGTEIEGTIEKAEFSGTGTAPECTGTFGNVTVDTNIGNGTPWCLKSGANDTFSVRGNSCAGASRSITFVLTSTTVGTCKYNREAAATGTFTTDTSGQDAVLSIVPTANSTWVKEEGSLLCPSSGELEMSFTLETDPESGATEPLYIQ